MVAEPLPTVTVHFAQTLDGRIATRTGRSQWISGEASLRLAHQLRADHDAVMVGRGTILADNPRLTVRLVEGRSPVRIVVDSNLRIPDDANVLADGAAPTIVATTERAAAERVDTLRRPGIEVLVLGQDEQGRVDLGELMRQLPGRGIHSVLIEGGSDLITTALTAGLVNRLVISIAPKIIGAGIEAIGNLEICEMDQALTFDSASFTPLGEDVIFDGQLARTGDEPLVSAGS